VTPRRRSWLMYLIAAVSFLIAGVVGFVGDSGAGAAYAAFIILSAVFIGLAVRVGLSGNSPDSS
jgi:L-cystine uptake protein TcyP (sodium:dicarboxylate symporter family)